MINDAVSKPPALQAHGRPEQHGLQAHGLHAHLKSPNWINNCCLVQVETKSLYHRPDNHEITILGKLLPIQLLIELYHGRNWRNRFNTFQEIHQIRQDRFNCTAICLERPGLEMLFPLLPAVACFHPSRLLIGHLLEKLKTLKLFANHDVVSTPWWHRSAHMWQSVYITLSATATMHFLVFSVLAQGAGVGGCIEMHKYWPYVLLSPPTSCTLQPDLRTFKPLHCCLQLRLMKISQILHLKYIYCQQDIPSLPNNTETIFSYEHVRCFPTANYLAALNRDNEIFSILKTS